MRRFSVGVCLAGALSVAACGNDGATKTHESGSPPVASSGSGGTQVATGAIGASGATSPAGAAGATASASGHGGTGLPSQPSGTGGRSASTGTGGSSQASAGSGGGLQPSGSTPLRVAITARNVAAAGENHVCVTAALSNDSAVWVNSIHTTLTTGSHHLIVDRKPVGTALATEASPCSPTMGGDSTRLLIAQQHETVLDLPAGTGLRIEPHQPIFLQLHYINLSNKTEDITGTVELGLFDASKGAPIEAQSLFAGALNISLPKHQSGMAEYFYMPPGTASRPLHAFAVTSHTHSLGVRSTIERVGAANAPDTMPIHESLDWSEPPLTRFDPPLTFVGSDGLRLRCQYQNDTDQDVKFGTRFEDEMCFMWFYFYFDQP